MITKKIFILQLLLLWFGDGVGNTVEENS